MDLVSVAVFGVPVDVELRAHMSWPIECRWAMSVAPLIDSKRVPVSKIYQPQADVAGID